MNFYEKLVIKINGEEYFFFTKVWYGKDVVRYYKTKEGKQLGSTGYSEKEIDEMIKK